MKTFKKATDLAEQNMTNKELTKLYVLGGVFWSLAIAAIVMIVRKIIRRK